MTYEGALEQKNIIGDTFMEDEITYHVFIAPLNENEYLPYIGEHRALLDFEDDDVINYSSGEYRVMGISEEHGTVFKFF